ncbi:MULTISPECIES: DUF1642 domain-containing protein [Lactobacillales]|uniref:DUF1642 domain-containing protein n=1 Tax=Lactobacillales TaxID=186826 RepID=UPI0039821103
MNKQELIERYKTKYAEEPKDWKHPSVNASRQDLFANFIRDLKQLDEPQKPVVPKFVAEWFEENKDDLEFPIWELCVDSYGSKDEHGMLNWIQQSENNPIETLIRMKDGYEVEKEPLYEVIIGDLYLIKKFNNRNDFYFDTSCSLCAWEKSAYQLTEAEIKAIDERYWPFAVPVEEVAEG